MGYHVIMAQRTFTVGIPEELEQRVVEAARRADVSRNAFVRRALEKALSEAKEPVLGEQAGSGSVGSSEPVKPAAPSRAPAANFGAVRAPYVKPFRPQPKS